MTSAWPERTVESELVSATADLAAAGCPEPEHDARALTAAALAIPADQLDAFRGSAVSHDQHQRLSATLTRRREREPLEYILGTTCFRGLQLVVDRRVLVPQAHTAWLVEVALQLPRKSRVHDVGTGSGALALAIKHERTDLVVSGSDLSAAAVAVARLNAKNLTLGVRFTVARGLPNGKFDLVVANLPYQDDAGHTLSLAPEFTSHQPHVAVFAGADGLDAIRELLDAAPTGTRIAFEHAASQTSAVHALLTHPETTTDPGGRAAFTVGLAR